MDFDVLRKRMVEEQLIPRGINDRKVLDSFYKVPRHLFVPQDSREFSYNDSPLAIGYNQTISQPYIVALMTQCLSLSGIERVLEIGTGSGYQTAILAQLCKEIYSVERIPSLAKSAQEVLEKLDYKNIKIKVGDGTLGWTEFAPFDAIIVTAAARDAPKVLIEQLDNDGRLVIPLGEAFSQTLTIVRKTKFGSKHQEVCGCVFVPLIGKYGMIHND